MRVFLLFISITFIFIIIHFINNTYIFDNHIKEEIEIANNTFLDEVRPSIPEHIVERFLVNSYTHKDMRTYGIYWRHEDGFCVRYGSLEYLPYRIRLYGAIIAFITRVASLDFLTINPFVENEGTYIEYYFVKGDFYSATNPGPFHDALQACGHIQMPGRYFIVLDDGSVEKRLYPR